MIEVHDRGFVPIYERTVCGCAACQKDGPHDSDCAVHNAPAYEPGPCDCSLERNEVRSRG